MMTLRSAILDICVCLALVSTVGAAKAVEPKDVEGSADFRGAPILSPGTYTDTVVTGEAVWYRVVYSDEARYRFSAQLINPPKSEEGVDLILEFYNPLLTKTDSGAGPLEGNAYITRDGGDYAYLWYFVLRLDTEGRLGVQHTVQFTIEGTLQTGLGPCVPTDGCKLKDELAKIEPKVEEVRATLGDGDVESAASVKELVNSLQSELEKTTTEVDVSQQRLAELCTPASTCQELPPPSFIPPLWLLSVSVLTLLAGVGFLASQRRLSRRNLAQDSQMSGP